MQIVFVALLGLAIGSFLNVLIIRIPKRESILFPSSHCQKCNRKLKWWHNIPLLSWLILRGKCHYCKEPIHIQYPLVELLTALIFVAIFLKIGFSLYSLDIAIVFSLLLALSVIDLRFKAVPDSINLAAATLALFSSNDLLTNLQNALLVAGALSMLRFLVSYYVSKKEELLLQKECKRAPWIKVYYPKYIMIEAMGEGDIIVGFTIGALLGIKLSLVALFLAALFAIPFSLYSRLAHRDRELPFIPFLAMGAFTSFLVGERLLCYLNI